MPQKTVIIIGAGLAGLSAGVFAQLNGYQSRILEHGSQPGGVAAWWKRGDYLFDGGIHFAMGHTPGTGFYRLCEQLGISPAVNMVDIETYGRFVHQPSGWSVTMTRDLDRLAADLKARSPADARLVDEIVSAARGMQGYDLGGLAMSAPPEMSGPLDQLGQMWAMRKLLKYMVGRLGRPMSDYVQGARDPVLRLFLENLFLPQSPVFFVAMLLAMLADGQLAFIEGGCEAYVGAIEQRYRALGGETTYRATVMEILVEKGRAVGVRLADGSEVRADAVIAACDGRSVLFDMLGGRYMTEKTRQHYATWQTFKPLLMATFGVARLFPGEPAFTTVILDRPFAIGSETIPGLFIRLFNYGEGYAPPGKSVLQATSESGWEHWNTLRGQDPALYRAEKRRVAGEILDRLEVLYPGLSGQVEVSDVATPYTTWRYTRNHEGAWEGWLMTAQAMRTSIERTLPGLERLYLAGQWVMPGGGVPPVLYSGRHAVQLLCRDDGMTGLP
ncbi:MAG TPA: NAD(P)/FAD-dependent oxidoreductase [Anaerolineae bacterium]|nr:NAD(P)/FAD-dependent oxidoreductase [Anaerolineae bacterium]